jgi:signal transduction histidine kinase/CheY-like chemotaxis protein
MVRQGGPSGKEKRLMPRVLVIDDQRIPRVTVGAALQEAGHEVTAEADGRSGIERAREWAPDVIVLDVHMPDMDGFSVVEKLKNDPLTAPIPVIFLTATAPTDELVVRGLDLGAYDFLSKGCSKAELLARVGVMARIKRSNDELTAIARIADTLLRSLDPRDLTTLFVEQTREVFRAHTAVMIVSPDEDMPAIRAAAGLDPSDPLFDALAEQLLAYLDDGDEAVVVPLEEIGGPAGTLIRRSGLRSAVAVRLEHLERAPSLLAVFVQRPDGFRRESDAPLLHLLARQAVIALDNALLHTRTREQARTLAEQADKLARAMTERSRFFASMSHELRTPINAVIGYSELLREGTYGPLPPQQQQAVTKITRSATHLLELINDVLDISKLEAGKLEFYFEPTDLVRLVRDTLTSVQLQAEEKGLELEVDASPDLREAEVVTDPARVRQVLLNLMANAVKFTDEGRVRVELGLRRVGPDAAQADGQSDYVWIRVSDTGPGIAPEDRERIFEEFEQAESGVTRGGTGLGLAISRKLAQLLGGRLELESSEPGVGSNFVVTIPTRPPRNA